MECKKETCGKIFTKAYSCSRCDLKFCSSSCMIDHFFIKHEMESQDNSMTNAIKNYKLSELKKNKKNSGNNCSFFIKNGEILKDIRLDSYFNIDNFEKVKMGNKLNLLGTGAFGEVYLVKNRRDGKLFAVKQMNKSRILSTGATLEIIRREIDIHCRLIHENIIRLYSFSEDDNSFYLLMEYADSGNLFRKIRKSKGLDEKSAFKYFIQTAAAIYFIHENNMIHRDIKPENLLLDAKDDIKLCDFGWCIELEIGNRNTICGTPEYMAPEIIKEMPYDKSIDIWSLGVLLYELLHGYSPFRSQNENNEEDNTQVMRNILNYNLTFDRKDLSDACCNIITKLLLPDKNSRLKIKDVFTHPWVIEFEKQLPNYTESIPINKNLENSPILAKKNSSNNIPKPSINNYSDILKPLTNQTSRKRSFNQIQEEDDKEGLKYNNIKKLNSTKEASISTAAEDCLSLPKDKTDSLFDKVLIQVKEKNRDKRKRSKIADESENDISRLNNQDQKYEVKREVGRKRSLDMKGKKTHDSNMLNEIKEIDYKLDKQIKDNNMKYESFQYRKEEFNKVIEKNRIGKISLYDSLEMEANEKVKLLIKGENNDNNSLLNKSKILENTNKEISISKSSTRKKIITNDSNKINKEDQSKNKKHFEENPLTLSHNVPKMKTNSNLSNQMPIGINNRDSFKTSRKFYSGNKQPDLNRELDMSFLPRDLLYNDKTYEQSANNLLSAIEILEKAQEDTVAEKVKPKSFWDIINPFKCG